jgi:serine/threonine protein phosphatase PrpC
MSMYGFSRRNQRSGRFAAPVFSILSGFLVVLQLMLVTSQTAHASSLASVATTSSIGTSGAVDFAQVSVVRLVATYQSPVSQVGKPATTLLAQCTGLGVMVASWASEGGADQNNWLLTDGSLVNPGQPFCLPTSSNSNLILERIDLYFNTVFNPAMVPAITVSPISVHCLVHVCNGGLALLSFATSSNQTFPHVDLASTNLAQDMALALRLSTAPGPIASLPTASNTNGQVSDQFVKDARGFLTPQQATLGDAKNPLEVGTPIFNQTGELTAVESGAKTTFSLTNLAQILSLLPNFSLLPAQRAVTKNVSTQTPAAIGPVHNNPVYENWKTGITSYYQGDFVTARSAFQKAQTGNALFQTPLAFEQLISNRLAKNTGNGQQEASSPLTFKFFGVQITIPDKKMLVVLILAVLAVLLVLIVAFLIRSRLRRRRVFKDYAELDRRADQEARRITAQEDAQKQQPASAPVASAFPVGRVKTSPLARVVMVPCPNCGVPVRLDDQFCSNCHTALATSESGYNVHTVMPPPQMSPAPMAPPRSLADQPTIDMTPGMSSDQPTLEMSPAALNGQTDPETTVPYGFAAQSVKGQRLGIVVGTRTDPGIKRKYKPNEDSLFAARWQREANADMLPVGLFVIADGMGGHANGQDASRTAIQTIIDFMLPKLSKTVDPHSKDLDQLLANAVQHANLVVHQHNMELRADMGTTVTAAMVVGATAYVSNVGDSRTYLYRPSDGLKKVTNDHSVVASLVEAGIIKPDDIYTHPKRNQIYRSLGEKAAVEVDSFIVQLYPGDKLLLCSDGLWDMVRDPKIEGVLKNAVPDPNVTAEALIQAALEGGGEDNVSVIIISFTETPQHTIEHGIQLLAKPDAVQMPQL